MLEITLKKGQTFEHHWDLHLYVKIYFGTVALVGWEGLKMTPPLEVNKSVSFTFK